MSRKPLQLRPELTISLAPLSNEQRPAWEAAWQQILKIIEADMTKSDYYSILVALGREYNRGAMFPQTQHASKENLVDRCTWMQRALELKNSDPNLAYNLYWAAWISGCIDNPTIAEKAGIA